MIAEFVRRQSEESLRLPVALMCGLADLLRRSYYHLIGRTQLEDPHIELGIRFSALHLNGRLTAIGGSRQNSVAKA